MVLPLTQPQCQWKTPLIGSDQRRFVLAGEEGFEPSNQGSKVPCLASLATPQGARIVTCARPSDKGARGATSSRELRQLDQVARRIKEDPPARIGVFFDTPGQLAVMSTSLCHCSIEIILGSQADDGELWRPGLSPACKAPKGLENLSGL